MLFVNFVSLNGLFHFSIYTSLHLIFKFFKTRKTFAKKKLFFSNFFCFFVNLSLFGSFMNNFTPEYIEVVLYVSMFMFAQLQFCKLLVS